MKNILHLIRGKQGETLAARYLQSQGIDIVDKNVRIGGGEIDLIGKDGEILLFIEVRLRKHGANVSAAESITPAKRQKWQRAASAYLQRHYANNPPDCRFDALCISQYQDGSHDIEWLRGVDI